jgi:hypothetical protein
MIDKFVDHFALTQGLIIKPILGLLPYDRGDMNSWGLFVFRGA